MFHTTSLRALWILGLCVGLLVACGDSDDDGESNPTTSATSTTGTSQTTGGTTGTTGSTGDTSGTTGASTGTTGSTGGQASALEEECGDLSSANADLIAQGTYFTAVSLESFGGLQVFLKVEIAATADTILGVAIYSVSSDKSWVSEDPVAIACDLPVNDRSFNLSFEAVALPGQGTPTGTEVVIENFALAGTFSDDALSFCGGVEGFVPLLGADLAGSTFKSVPDGEESTPPEASCEAVAATTYDPIALADCPDIALGNNELESAELDRTFRVYHPETLPDGPLPVVFLYHGLGGGAAGIVSGTNFNALAESEGFILIAPDGANDEDGERVFPTEWNYLNPWFTNDNPDLVFFDDMLACIRDQYTVDDDRIYVTGMSAGGLFTTFVGLHRSEVVAAAAPGSGGYSLSFPEDLPRRIPFMVNWGGVNDVAVGTPFHDLSVNLIANLTASGHDTIACNHNQEHTWPAEITGPVWQWLSAFDKTMDTHPFVENGLPEDFLSYCEIPDAD